MELDSATLIRFAYILATVACFILFAFRYVRSFKSLSRGQKMYIGAMLMFMLTVMWDTSVFIIEGTDLSTRLVPYTLALLLCIGYLTEPYHRVRVRFGADVYTESNSDVAADATELRRLKIENDELRDQAYDLARRCNELTLQTHELRRKSNA